MQADDEHDGGAGAVIDIALTVAAFVREFPAFAAAVVWWAASRWASKLGVGMAWLGPLVLLVWLYKNRRDLRAVVVWVSAILAAVVWAFMLYTDSALRRRVGIGAASTVALMSWVWWVNNYPTLPFRSAVKVWVLTRNEREVMSDAAKVATGDTARVLKVTPPARLGDPVEAEIIGPAGWSHTDLVDALRERLAPAVLSVSGRPLHDVVVVGTGAKGRVRVQCLTSDPLAQTVRWEGQ